MKKMIYGLALALVVTGSAYAQKDNVKAVERIIKSDKANFDEARKLIDAAKTNAETQNDAQTWFVAGSLENGQFQELNLKSMVPNAQVDKGVMYNALINVYPNFAKADSLDRLPDANGKVKAQFEKKIGKELKQSHLHLINAGAYFMNEKKFDKAAEAFEQFLAVKEMPMFAGDKEMNPQVDSNAMIAGYYGLASYYQGKEFDKAIALAKKIKDVPYQQSEVYQMWGTACLAKQDTTGYMEVMKIGLEKFPQDKFYLLNIANTYIQQGKTEEAITMLNKAIEMDPKNPQLYDVMGKLYEGKEDFDNAEVWFKKSIEVDPKYGDGVYDLARTYYNRAVALKSGEKINAQTEAKAKEWFQKSLPLMEQAYELMPDETWYVLSTLYYNLGMTDKSEALKAKHANK